MSGESKQQDLSEDEVHRLGFARLIAVLLSPRTFPHLLLLVVTSSILYSYVKRSEDSGVVAAMAYISFAMSYTIIALAARSERWKDLIQTTPFKDTESKGFSAWAIHQLQQLIKVVIPPLILSALIMGILFSIFSEGRPLEGWAEGVPLALAALFIAWSIGQAISFRMTVKGIMFGRPMFMDETTRSPHLLSSSIVQILIVQLLGFSMLWIFQSAATTDTVAPGQILKDHFAYLLVLLAGQASIHVWARPAREYAGHSIGGARSSFGLGICIQLFAAWHLLSIWRKFSGFGEPEIVSTIEELSLMIMTVILAIYGLSSRSLQVDSQYFTEQNALFWGLTFGFGYAGSISMIAIVLNDVSQVLMLGHGITYLTLMYLHRSSILQLPWKESKTPESITTDMESPTPDSDAEEEIEVSMEDEGEEESDLLEGDEITEKAEDDETVSSTQEDDEITEEDENIEEGVADEDSEEEVVEVIEEISDDDDVVEVIEDEEIEVLD